MLSLIHLLSSASSVNFIRNHHFIYLVFTYCIFQSNFIIHFCDIRLGKHLLITWEIITFIVKYGTKITHNKNIYLIYF